LTTHLAYEPTYLDTGVLNGLLDNFTASADRIGLLFEHLIFNQLVDSASAKDVPIRISSYRTAHGAEVDFIVELEGETVAVEVKAVTRVDRVDTRGFQSFAESYGRRYRPVVVYLGSVQKRVNGIDILPWPLLFSTLRLSP